MINDHDMADDGKSGELVHPLKKSNQKTSILIWKQLQYNAGSTLPTFLLHTSAKLQKELVKKWLSVTAF